MRHHDDCGARAASVSAEPSAAQPPPRRQPCRVAESAMAGSRVWALFDASSVPPAPGRRRAHARPPCRSGDGARQRQFQRAGSPSAEARRIARSRRAVCTSSVGRRSGQRTGIVTSSLGHRSPAPQWPSARTCSGCAGRRLTRMSPGALCATAQAITPSRACAISAPSPSKVGSWPGQRQLEGLLRGAGLPARERRD